MLPPVTYIAETDFRNQRRAFGIKHADRRSHMYVIGKTGAGKSTLLKNLITQDIQNGQGLAVIDPHGDLVSDVLDHIPAPRTGEVVYFDPGDRDFPIGFNIFESVDPSLRPLVAAHVISVFKNIWSDSWGPRLEYILHNAVLSLLDVEGSTLLGVPRLLADKEYRARVVSKVKDPLVRNFWTQEYEQYSPEFQKEAIAPIQNKVGQFLTSSPIRNIVGQVRSKIDMGFMMDNQRVFLCNLAKGKIGDANTSLLGSLLVTKIFLAALRRVEQPEEARKDFFLFVDECHTLATPIFSSILSEARKYHLNLTISHQFLGQLPREIQRAILGNVGTLITFRLGAEDAGELIKEFTPECRADDLINLERYQIYCKLAVDGLASRPFSGRTLPPAERVRNAQTRETITRTSRERYGTPREVIEEKINRWLSQPAKNRDLLQR